MPAPFSASYSAFCPTPSCPVWAGRLVLAWLAALLFFFPNPGRASEKTVNIEKEVLAYIQRPEFSRYAKDGRCRNRSRYKVFLIDNFELTIPIVPELVTTHGELLVRLLKSGRDDIEARPLDTTLTRGLATVILHLARGGCADAVISSVPGSNYTYDQIQTLLPRIPDLNPDTRIAHRQALKTLLREIAFKGFPSVRWVSQVDINLSKLREDAVKLVFIQALEHFGVRVLLPYGNPDTPHNGDPRVFNLLSLADNALVYTGLNRTGQRVRGFPYSPLSSGDETAVFALKECPDPDHPGRALLDINEDGRFDYAYPLDKPPASVEDTARNSLRDQDGCRIRGLLKGTSVIPPLKVKELLPPK